jgi:hypothetical protein
MEAICSFITSVEFKRTTRRYVTEGKTVFLLPSNQNSACYLTYFSFGLFFESEYGGDMYLRNVGWLPTDYTPIYPRRYNISSVTYLYVTILPCILVTRFRHVLCFLCVHFRTNLITIVNQSLNLITIVN